MKILLDFIAKVGKEDIFKPTIGNESLHEISNDNRVRVAQLCHIKNPYCQKYDVSTSLTFIKLLGRLLMGARTIKLTIF
jgi:hypothetical protein